MLGVLAGLAFGLPAAPVAAAPFVYVVNRGMNSVSQFNAPLASFQALVPLSPATVGTGGNSLAVAISPDGNSAYVINNDDDTVSQYSIDSSTGKLSPKSPATVATGRNPLAVAISPDGKSAYVTIAGCCARGTVSQYSIAPSTGKLSPKSPATVATGAFPEGVAVSPDGRSAYVTNLTDNAVSQYSIDPSTGALSPKAPASVATGTGPKGIAVSPDGKSAYVTNSTVPDTVSQYTIAPSTGKLSPKSPATVATGGFPEGVAVSPDGKNAYVTNSTAPGTVSQYSINPSTGKLSPKSPATVATGGFPFAVGVTPGGKSVYVTNGSDDTVSQYNVDPSTGALSRKAPASVATGTGPRGIAVSPVANVSVSVSAPASVKSGSELSYTITVANAGPSNAWRVALTDQLPFGTQFQKTSTTSGSCTGPKAGTRGGTVTCKLGKIKAGKTAGTQRIQVKITATANQGVITDNAKATSVTPDPTHRNNAATVQTKITK